MTRYLLLARERVRPGRESAYDDNERQLAGVAAALGCPHPYLAVATLQPPLEVWWVNAFSSQQERDGLSAAYARNQPLMEAMGPLGQRKEAFRESLTSVLTEYRSDLSGGTILRIAGSRYFVVDTMPADGAGGAIFEAADEQRFAIATTRQRDAAQRLADALGARAIVLEVQPQWSFPAAAWIDADPELWQCSIR